MQIPSAEKTASRTLVFGMSPLALLALSACGGNQSQSQSFSVTNTNDVPTGAVTISGTASKGEVLTAASTLMDAEGLGPLSFQWSEDGVAISGATTNKLTLDESHVGKAITVDVSYTDGAGTFEKVTSGATSSVTIKNDAPTGAVTISGTATQGEVLTAVSTLADADGLGTLSYQWSAGGDAISGATSSTLTLGQSEVGETITVAVSYTDGGGTVETKVSSATSAVLPPLFDVAITSQTESIVTLDLVSSSLADPSDDGIDSFELELIYDPNVFELFDLRADSGFSLVPNTETDGVLLAAAISSNPFAPFTDLDEPVVKIDLKILDTSAPSSISLSSLVSDNGNLESTHDLDFDFDNDLLIMSDIV